MERGFIRKEDEAPHFPADERPSPGQRSTQLLGHADDCAVNGVAHCLSALSGECRSVLQLDAGIVSRAVLRSNDSDREPRMDRASASLRLLKRAPV